MLLLSPPAIFLVFLGWTVPLKTNHKLLVDLFFCWRILWFILQMSAGRRLDPVAYTHTTGMNVPPISTELHSWHLHHLRSQTAGAETQPKILLPTLSRRFWMNVVFFQQAAQCKGGIPGNALLEEWLFQLSPVVSAANIKPDLTDHWTHRAKYPHMHCCG